VIDVDAGPSKTAWWASGLALVLAVCAIGFLATAGSLGAGFAVMTDCTNSYNCDDTGCPPCGTADSWLTWGWVAQLTLLVATLAVAPVLGIRRRAGALGVAAVVLLACSIGTFVGTTKAASDSYCRPGEQVVLTGVQENYCPS
jgi:hypothetical protein